MFSISLSQNQILWLVILKISLLVISANILNRAGLDTGIP